MCGARHAPDTATKLIFLVEPSWSSVDVQLLTSSRSRAFVLLARWASRPRGIRLRRPTLLLAMRGLAAADSVRMGDAGRSARAAAAGTAWLGRSLAAWSASCASMASLPNQNGICARGVAVRDETDGRNCIHRACVVTTLSSSRASCSGGCSCSQPSKTQTATHLEFGLDGTTTGRYDGSA